MLALFYQDCVRLVGYNSIYYIPAHVSTAVRCVIKQNATQIKLGCNFKMILFSKRVAKC